ncbi:endocuticle structural protein SgAbd-6-like [Diabrotica undecimpunctata]|uniref:endocuticle structural protein SgAbd-6-like n=1 Tax=Diabrotica undecimpunctata TaxID=50387 RepID=UPI003B635118
MFKVALFVIACLAFAQARPQAESKILRFDNDVRQDGYQFGFETSDGIRREENGVFQATADELGILTVNGESSYPLGDGLPFYISFVADDKGYRPKYVIGQGAPGNSGVARAINPRITN